MFCTDTFKIKQSLFGIRQSQLWYILDKMYLSESFEEIPTSGLLFNQLGWPMQFNNKMKLGWKRKALLSHNRSNSEKEISYEQLSEAALPGSVQGQGKAFPSQHKSRLCPPWAPGWEMEEWGLCLRACPWACLAPWPRSSSRQLLPPRPTQNWAAGGSCQAPAIAGCQDPLQDHSGCGGPLPVKLQHILPKGRCCFPRVYSQVHLPEQQHQLPHLCNTETPFLAGKSAELDYGLIKEGVVIVIPWWHKCHEEQTMSPLCPTGQRRHSSAGNLKTPVCFCAGEAQQQRLLLVSLGISGSF